jgi:hypothetical protein
VKVARAIREVPDAVRVHRVLDGLAAFRSTCRAGSAGLTRAAILRTARRRRSGPAKEASAARIQSCQP